MKKEVVEIFCYAKLMEALVLPCFAKASQRFLRSSAKRDEEELRSNILRQNNFSEAKEPFLLLLRRRIDKKLEIDIEEKKQRIGEILLAYNFITKEILRPKEARYARTQKICENS